MTTQNNPEVSRTTKTVGTRQYTLEVVTFTDSLRGVVRSQPINPKTGKPWQATRYEFNEFGDEAPAQALSLYLKLEVA